MYWLLVAPRDASASPPDDPSTTGRTLITPQMLRSAKDFAALQRSRRVGRDELVVVRYRKTELDAIRFGFATSSKLGGAVVRNRVRRQLRSIVRGLAPRLEGGWDVLISVRPAGAAVSQGRLGGSVEATLHGAGILKGATQDT
ncbi:MAG: ribonuclease P protein component [Candidatus Limnocylindrales bacterium]